MNFIKYILIPFKLILKLLGYIIVAILKVIGWLISVIGGVCGLVTGIVGGIAILASVFYLIMGAMNMASIQEMSHWWVPGATGCVFGAVIASMGAWAVYVGEFLSDLGGNLLFELQQFKLL